MPPAQLVQVAKCKRLPLKLPSLDFREQSSNRAYAPKEHDQKKFPFPTGHGFSWESRLCNKIQRSIYPTSKYFQVIMPAITKIPKWPSSPPRLPAPARSSKVSQPPEPAICSPKVLGRFINKTHLKDMFCFLFEGRGLHRFRKFQDLTGFWLCFYLGGYWMLASIGVSCLFGVFIVCDHHDMLYYLYIKLRLC